MDYRKMWYELRGTLGKVAGDKGDMRCAAYRDVILNMSAIEDAEYRREKEEAGRGKQNEPSQKSREQQEKEWRGPRTEEVDIIPEFIVEKILGQKPITSLEELKEKITVGEPAFTGRNKLYIDESVDIPEEIIREAHRKGYTLCGVSVRGVCIEAGKSPFCTGHLGK